MEFSWGDYMLPSESHQDHVKLHHKSLHFVLELDEGWILRAGLRHFVQWGGMEQEVEQETEILNDYFRAVTGRQGGTTPSNHLGSWEAKVGKELRNSYLEFYSDIPFENGQGAKFENFPDGRFGMYWKQHDKERLVNALLYEFYITETGKQADYFNHSAYQSGWTYRRRVLGVPFVTYDPARDRITNNIFLAHHIGIAGDTGNYYEPFPYLLLLSFSENHGTPINPFPSKTRFSTLYQTRLYNGSFLINLQLAADFGSSSPPNYAAGISVLYSLK